MAQNPYITNPQQGNQPGGVATQQPPSMEQQFAQEVQQRGMAPVDMAMEEMRQQSVAAQSAALEQGFQAQAEHVQKQIKGLEGQRDHTVPRNATIKTAALAGVGAAGGRHVVGKARTLIDNMAKETAKTAQEAIKKSGDSVDLEQIKEQYGQRVHDVVEKANDNGITANNVRAADLQQYSVDTIKEGGGLSGLYSKAQDALSVSQDSGNFAGKALATGVIIGTTVAGIGYGMHRHNKAMQKVDAIDQKIEAAEQQNATWTEKAAAARGQRDFSQGFANAIHAEREQAVVGPAVPSRS